MNLGNKFGKRFGNKFGKDIRYASGKSNLIIFCEEIVKYYKEVDK